MQTRRLFFTWCQIRSFLANSKFLIKIQLYQQHQHIKRIANDIKVKRQNYEVNWKFSNDAIMIKLDWSRIKLYYDLCLKFSFFVAIQNFSFISVKTCDLLRTNFFCCLNCIDQFISCIIITFYMMIDVIISYNIFAKIHAIIETNARDRDYDVIKNRTNINRLIDEFKFVNYVCDRNTIYKNVLSSVYETSTVTKRIVHESSNWIITSNRANEKRLSLIRHIITKSSTKSMFIQYIVAMKWRKSCYIWLIRKTKLIHQSIFLTK